MRELGVPSLVQWSRNESELLLLLASMQRNRSEPHGARSGRGGRRKGEEGELALIEYMCRP